MKVSDKFTVAAAFGNVHGVYKPGNVELRPIILKNSQEHIREKFGIKEELPINFVFHGGSGSSPAEIEEAISYGAIKMNIDTDLQWAFWDGVRGYSAGKFDYLQGQIGNQSCHLSDVVSLFTLLLDTPPLNVLDLARWEARSLQ